MDIKKLCMNKGMIKIRISLSILLFFYLRICSNEVISKYIRGSVDSIRYP